MNSILPLPNLSSRRNKDNNIFEERGLCKNKRNQRCMITPNLKKGKTTMQEEYIIQTPK